MFKRNISSDSRIFAKYTIYKNSGALGIAPINQQEANIRDSYTVEKPGVLLLKFASTWDDNMTGIINTLQLV